jgi:hypothetical protein
VDSSGLKYNPTAGFVNWLSIHNVQTGFGANPASYPMGIGSSFPGVKRLGRGAYHTPPSSAEVKNTWLYKSIPPYVFMA